MGVNYDFVCHKCKETTVENVRYELRDDPLDCGICGEVGAVKRYYGKMPSVPVVSYLDGKKREGWGDMLTEAKLKEAAASKKWNSSDVKEIHKELDEREEKARK